MAREGQIQGFSANPIFISTGTGGMVSFGFTSPQVANIILKYGSGGSLEVSGISNLVPGNGYLMGATESLTMGGPAQFWLCATGATVTAFVLQGRTIFPGQA